MTNFFYSKKKVLLLKAEEEVNRMDDEEGRVLLPGDYIATTEEFIPDEGTYEEMGRIYAAVPGRLDLCMSEMTAKIVPEGSSPVILREGNIVIGRVVRIAKGYVYVDLFSRRGEDRNIAGNRYARLHISKISVEFVKDTYQVFSENDIIRGRVIQTEPSLEISTAEKELGIIKSECHKCTATLMCDNGRLVCGECEIVLKRKIADDYGRWSL